MPRIYFENIMLNSCYSFYRHEKYLMIKKWVWDSCFCMQTSTKKNPCITQKIKKNSDKDFLVLTKGSIEGQGYGFSPKWKDNKSRGEMEKTWEKGGSLYIFERFVILYVTITPNKVLEYALNKSLQCMLCYLFKWFYFFIYQHNINIFMDVGWSVLNLLHLF